jgi:hypothetical protein
MYCSKLLKISFGPLLLKTSKTRVISAKEIDDNI